MNTTELGISQRDRLEVDADFARSRLIGILAELEDRGKRFLDIRKHLGRHLDLIAFAAATITVLVLGRVADWVWRRTHLAEERWLALQRAWKHPHRLAW